MKNIHIVTVRSNIGNDSLFEAKSKEDATALVKQHATTVNHMICVEIDGERTDRWDRERYKGENRWHRTDPDEMEVIGPRADILRG